MANNEIKEKIKTIVVDFDGTISDTPLDFYLMRQSVRKAIKPYIDLPKERSKTILLLEEIALLSKDYDAETIGKISKLTEEAIIDVEVEAASRAKLFPNVENILVKGKDKGIKFGIITRNCRKAVDTVFPNAKDYFGSIVTRHDTEKVKPEPEHLLKALSELKSSPQETLMVGDHPTDIQTGKSAGSYTAGVGTGEGTKESLKAESPDFYTDDFTKLAIKLGLWN